MKRPDCDHISLILDDFLERLQVEENFYPWSAEPEVGQLLHALIRLLRPQVVLELGTFKGFTTLQLIKAIPGAAKTDIITIDTKDYRSPILKLPEVEDRYTFLLGDDVEIIPTIRRKIDFAFVDTTHTYYHTVAEISAIRVNNPMAIVVLHDSLSHKGVREAVQLFAKQHFSSITLPTPFHPTREVKMSGITILLPQAMEAALNGDSIASNQ